jgi:UDP-N-acetylglucosamine 2-epimerase
MILYWVFEGGPILKIVTIVGARPQFVKAAPLSTLVRQRHSEILVHTGQHYDKNMSELFFSELNIPLPDYNLAIGSGSHGMQTGRMLEKIENILLSEKPDGVVVYGDTNSTLAGALAASKLHIPIFHVEAGLRSYNKLMPEEQNRVLTDHLSTLLLCPTRTAVNNLAKEGITEGVFFTGDIMYDAVLRFSTLSEQRYGNGRWLREMANVCNNEISKLSTKNYYLATIHRAENTDNKDRLQEIFEAFGELDKPVLVPMHPRTRHVIGDSISSLASDIIVIEPVGYLLMLYLTANAYMVLTDSGGLQKEAYFLKTPCTTLRDETEWIETLENGWNVLSTVDSSSIIRNATRPLSCLQQDQRMEFGEGRAAEMIVERIEERLGA